MLASLVLSANDPSSLDAGSNGVVWLGNVVVFENTEPAGGSVSREDCTICCVLFVWKC